MIGPRPRRTFTHRHAATLLAATLLLMYVPGSTGHGSSGDAEPGRLVTADVNHTATAGFAIYVPGGQVFANQQVVVSLANQGPGAVQAALMDGNTAVATLTLPPNSVTQHIEYWTPQKANLSVDLSTNYEDSASRVAFVVDYTSPCEFNSFACLTKYLEFRIGDEALVMGIPIAEAGKFRTTIPKPDVHELDFQLMDPAGKNVPISTYFSAGSGEYSFDWQGEPGQYTVRIQSTSANPDPFYEAGGWESAAAFELIRVSAVTEGPIVKATPGPALPLLVGLLALVALRRR